MCGVKGKFGVSKGSMSVVVCNISIVEGNINIGVVEGNIDIVEDKTLNERCSLNA